MTRNSAQPFDVEYSIGRDTVVSPLADSSVSYVELAGYIRHHPAPTEEFLESIHRADDSSAFTLMQAFLLPRVRRGVHNSQMKESLLRTFGERMKWARERKHYEQQQVAEFCGKESHMTVAHWESGANFPSLDALVAAAGLYEVSIDWLVWGGDVAGGIDERVKKIPPIFRAGLLDKLHKEIDETEKAVERLPAEMRASVVKDSDERLKGWSARNKKAEERKRKKVKSKGSTQ